MIIGSTLLVTALAIPHGPLAPVAPLAPGGTGPVLAPLAPVHCQVPCGIYGDRTRIDLLLEHAATIEKAMLQIDEIGAAAKPNWNQLVRWINTKEEHAQKIQDQVSGYWLAQRVKPPVAGESTEEALQTYITQLVLMHQMTTTAMKCKQSTDVANVAEIRRFLDSFQAVYFTEEDLEHLKEHGDHGEHGAAGPTGPIQKARVAMAKATIMTLSDATLEFRMNNLRAPDSLEVLVTPDDKGTTYLDADEIPLDPWGNAYVYEAPGGGLRDPKIMSYGADGKPGGTGVNADITLEDIKSGH